MNFLINNIGWFFCITIISVLALIGYKVDKKEKQQNNIEKKQIPENNDKSEEKIEQKNDLFDDPIFEKPEEKQQNNDNDIENNMADLYEPLEPIQNENNVMNTLEIPQFGNEQENNTIEDLYQPLQPIQEENMQQQEIINNNTQSQEQTENINQLDQQQEIAPSNNEEIPEIENIDNDLKTKEPTQNEQIISNQQIVPDINNSENLNISLQDLEDKNNTKSIEINQISSNILENQEVIEKNIEQVQNQEINENAVQSETQNYKTSENNEVKELQYDNIEDTEIKNIEQEEKNIRFDNEVNEEKYDNLEQTPNDIKENIEETDIIQPIQNSENEANKKDMSQFDNKEQNYVGEIPEIFTQTETNNSVEQPNLKKIENNNEESNLYTNSYDDDIWKF